MSRQSSNEVIDGKLVNGFDYEHQAWVVDSKYVDCGHPSAMLCGCYGRANEGKPSKAVK